MARKEGTNERTSEVNCLAKKEAVITYRSGPQSCGISWSALWLEKLFVVTHVVVVGGREGHVRIDVKRLGFGVGVGAISGGNDRGHVFGLLRQVLTAGTGKVGVYVCGGTGAAEGGSSIRRPG